jgi:hypothetical protein
VVCQWRALAFMPRLATKVHLSDDLAAFAVVRHP